jgi:hypothetical protein
VIGGTLPVAIVSNTLWVETSVLRNALALGRTLLGLDGGSQRQR